MLIKNKLGQFLKIYRFGELVYKDAVYFSVHKFVGGPQTPVA